MAFLCSKTQVIPRQIVFWLAFVASHSNSCRWVLSFTAPPNTRSDISIALQDRMTARLFATFEPIGKQDCDPCANLEEDDPILDRHEAAYAMLGTAWALGTLPTTLLFPVAP
jgi:hypothetical protein